jgi:hypothetical protein
MKKLKHKKSRCASTVNCRRALPLSGLTVATLALLPVSFTAGAAVISGSENSAFFETLLNQNDTTYVDPTAGGANVGPNACVPTAVAQGLSYLEGYQTQVLGKPTPFTASPNNVAAIDALAGAMTTAQNDTTENYGTTYPNRVTGTTTYLSPTGANPSRAYVSGGQYDSSYSGAANIGNTVQSTMQAVSTANFLAYNLNVNHGVEFAIRWGTLAGTDFTSSGGGHFVTLQSICFNTTTDTGEISFIDPGDATLVEDAALSVTSDGNLYVSYPAVPDADVDNDEEPLGIEGVGLDGAGASPGGIIINDLAEAVPDGGLTAGFLGASVLGLLTLRRRYSFSV